MTKKTTTRADDDLERRHAVLTAEIELRAVEARRIQRDTEQAEEERAAREHLAALQA